ncbi:hypothetical protein [Streptomyces wuyuanensis]|uniref:hypothetical protein n=1 Tax=Streptomyces wuyuanensis TaxID=1196353 RepID=UPI00342761CD
MRRDVLQAASLVGEDGVMAAASRKITALADAPAPWPIGVPGSQLVEVEVEDADHGVRVGFRFGSVPGSPLEVLTVSIEGREGLAGSAEGSGGLPASVFREAPLSRWERAARAAAERRLVAAGPGFQQVAPEVMAEMIVAERFPELAGAVGGNALRRRKGLLHLAAIVQEYKLAEEQGASNPAQLLAETHGVSPGTVRSWLTRARREGLAPESSHPNATPRP